MEIRDARTDDLAALPPLAVGQPLFVRYGLEAGGLLSSLSGALAKGDGLLLAEELGRPLGFAWWSPRGAFARSPYLRLLVVAAEASGRGVGGSLLGAVETRAFGRAADLFLLVTEENHGARRFYGRHGYRDVGTLPDCVVPGITEVLMRKRRPEPRGARHPEA
jgi:GNAT superfamily N-acetyltransferase